MQLSAALLSLGLLLAPAASAVKVRVWQNNNCTGRSQEVNIYDNTCGTWMMGFQSFQFLHAGGRGQRMTAWSANACAGVENWYGHVDNVHDDGACHRARDHRGGSNAISSYTI